MGRVDFQIVIVRLDMVLTNLPCGASCFRKAHIDNEVENVCPYSWIGGGKGRAGVPAVSTQSATGRGALGIITGI
jgi:hypothetical protein